MVHHAALQTLSVRRATSFVALTAATDSSMVSNGRPGLVSGKARISELSSKRLNNSTQLMC